MFYIIGGGLIIASEGGVSFCPRLDYTRVGVGLQNVGAQEIPMMCPAAGPLEPEEVAETNTILLC